MYQLTDYGKSQVAKYSHHHPYWSGLTVPWATFPAANAITNLIPGDDCSDDVLITELGVDFLNALCKIKILDNTQYSWMQQENFVSIHTVAGAATQVMPILPLPIEYFIPANSKLYFQFQNAATSPATTNGFLTFRGLRLKDKIKN
jgi:hypothetical protein